MNTKLLLSIEQLDLQHNPTVLVRLDLNVPMKNGKILDDNRIQAALPTLKYLLDRQCRIIMCSHLGRPVGKGFEEAFSLLPVGTALSALLDKEVILCDDYLSSEFPAFCKTLDYKKQIILLENLRFYPQEQQGDSLFCEKLAALAQLYVNDAFGTCHRADASVYGVPQLFSHYQKAAGFLVQKEFHYLASVLKSPKPPVTVILGGAKVSDKIEILKKFTQIANHIIIGGAMAYTFLYQRGVNVGLSKIEKDKLSLVENIFHMASQRNVTIHLPQDHVCATGFLETATPILCPGENIESHMMGLDIGPLTAKAFTQVISQSSLVLWNGPMGVYEWDAFKTGTVTMARAMAQNPNTTVVGGGDTAAIIMELGLAPSFTHVSTGGGASLELLEGKSLPGLIALYTKE